jgi:hypothetical protein
MSCASSKHRQLKRCESHAGLLQFGLCVLARQDYGLEDRNMSYAGNPTGRGFEGLNTLQVMSPELAWAIQVASGGKEEVLARAVTTLGLLLEGVRLSRWQEVAWRFSYLTGDGFPIECVFSSTDCDVRYTAEVAGPESNPAQRLERAERLLRRLGAGKLPETNIFRLGALQRAGELCYGTWMGVRHCFSENRFKLYVEVPPAKSDAGCKLFSDAIGELPLPTAYTQGLRIIGIEIGLPRIEFYFRRKDLTLEELRLLMRQAGLGARQAELFDLISEAIDRPVRDPLPGSPHGFSVSMDSGGGPTIFSLFGFARSFFGSDCSIRRQLLKLAEKRGWNLDQYARCSQPLSDRMSWKTFHGIVSFVVRPEGPLGLHIGLRPPQKFSV